MINKSVSACLLSKPASILSGQTKSVAMDLGGLTLVGILLRAFTGTALTFEVCDTIDGAFVPLKSTTSGSALSYTVAQNTYAAIDPKDFQGVNFLKLVSGGAEAADRTPVLMLKGF